MAIAVSLINMKGGVGKTTIAAQLAHSARSDGHRVLAVDLDPQSNLSQALMGPRRYVNHLQTDAPTVAQVFDDYVPAQRTSGAPRRLNIHDVVLHIGQRTKGILDLIPSRLELSRTLKNPTGKERRIAKCLAQFSDLYDLILIDCAPTESIANNYGWNIFETKISHSASYPRASRQATPLWETPYSRGYVCDEFDKLKDEIFHAIGLVYVCRG